MNRTARAGIASRAFWLATVVGPGLAFGETGPGLGAVLLAGVATCAAAVLSLTPLPAHRVHLVEGVAAAAVIGTAVPDSATLLPYLMLPALLTGLVATYRHVIVVAGFETLALLVVLAVAGVDEAMREHLRVAAPWTLAGLGAGLLAVWAVELRIQPVRDDTASYESARRLLAQLRTVARRLSSGLDPVSMAAQVIAVTGAALTPTRTAVFVRTEGGVLAPLDYEGYAARERLAAEGRLVERCWAEAEPVHEVRPAAPAEVRHRFVLPLRSGTRMIGVVVCETGAPADPATLGALMRELDDQAVRLDTALVFDEVRALATTEERQRLAREIHDGVAQEVASLGYLVDELDADARTDEQREGLRRLRSEVSRVVSELRLSIFDLRSEISPTAGVGSALSDHVRAVGARSGLTVHLTLDEAPTRLRTEVETELLRIAQEAVTNARKHSGADNLWVDCRIRPPFARITVEDDGKGLGVPRHDSYGFRIMRERAQRINARLDIGRRDPAAGTTGTKVSVTVGDDPYGDG